MCYFDLNCSTEQNIFLLLRHLRHILLFLFFFVFLYLEHLEELEIVEIVNDLVYHIRLAEHIVHVLLENNLENLLPWHFVVQNLFLLLRFLCLEESADHQHNLIEYLPLSYFPLILRFLDHQHLIPLPYFPLIMRVLDLLLDLEFLV